jgi:hypothetical protein
VGDAVQQVKEGDAEVVGHDRAVETPPLAEDTGEHLRVGRDRHTVDLGVRVHDAAGVAVEDSHLERDEQHIRELPRAGVDRSEVASGPRGGVAGEVLDRRVDPLRLQADDVRGAQAADEIRVLGDALVDPPPTRIAYDVQHRRQALMDAQRPHRGADRRAHPRDQFAVERGAPGQWRRVGGRLPGRESGEALLVHDRRDAEPGPGNEVALELPQPGRAGGRIDRPGAVRSGQMTEPVPGELPQRRGVTELALQRSDRLAVLPLPEADELRDLLGQCHPAQQISDAGLAVVGTVPAVGPP